MPGDQGDRRHLRRFRAQDAGQGTGDALRGRPGLPGGRAGRPRSSAAGRCTCSGPTWARSARSRCTRTTAARRSAPHAGRALIDDAPRARPGPAVRVDVPDRLLRRGTASSRSRARRSTPTPTRRCALLRPWRGRVPRARVRQAEHAGQHPDAAHALTQRPVTGRLDRHGRRRTARLTVSRAHASSFSPMGTVVTIDEHGRSGRPGRLPARASATQPGGRCRHADPVRASSTSCRPSTGSVGGGCRCARCRRHGQHRADRAPDLERGTRRLEGRSIVSAGRLRTAESSDRPSAPCATTRLPPISPPPPVLSVRSFARRPRPGPRRVPPLRRVYISPASSSGMTSTSRAFEPSDGPTIERDSIRSISRPALAKPTRSLRCSIEVEPNWVETTSSTAARNRSRSSPISSSTSFLAAAAR